MIVLRRLPAERAHRLALQALRLVAAVPGCAGWMRRRLGPRGSLLRVHALGLTFPGPLGVAAGLDKDARCFEQLGLLGFGHVEVGTVTALPQAGNPRPRIFRVVEDRALLNRMGFPNPGAREVAARLRRRRRRGRGEGAIVGVNVGKSMSVPVSEAGTDYRASVRELAPLCDYLAINVSSPNTPGLREMQKADSLRSLLAQVRSELAATASRTPVLVKISPDVSDTEIDAIAELALELSLDGIVAVNTTTDRAVLSHPAKLAAIEGGGVSGPPLRARALEVLRRLRERVGDSLVLVSVGGIATPEDAWERILAGATLVQAYSGFVYGGPRWPARVNRHLERRVREAGAASIQELIGAGVPPGGADAPPGHRGDVSSPTDGWSHSQTMRR